MNKIKFGNYWKYPLEKQRLGFTAKDFADMIYAVIDGLYLYEQISDSDDCVDMVESMVSNILKAIDAFQENDALQIVLNTTDALGWSGPIARRCYSASTQVGQRSTFYFFEIASFEEYMS